MLGRLPETALTILPSIFAKGFCNEGWVLLRAVISQLASGEFAETIQCLLETLGVKICIEQNGVVMIGHDDIGENTQFFIADAKIQAVNDELTGGIRMNTGSQSTTLKVMK